MGVNAELFNAEGGFAEWMEAAQRAGRVRDSSTATVQVYAGGLGAAGEEGLGSDNATATVMLFRRA